MLHISKLAVGVSDLAHLRALQQARITATPPLRHLTRNFPRRAAEVTAGGSLYWVVRGVMMVRQRVLDITESSRDDGSPCTALVLDHTLVPVVARPVKAFQGWRYLTAGDAPVDFDPSMVAMDDLPDHLRAKLQELCLL